MFPILVIVGLIGFAALAMRRAPVWQWAALWVVLALLNLVILDPFALVVAADPFRWLLLRVPGLILGCSR